MANYSFLQNIWVVSFPISASRFSIFLKGCLVFFACLSCVGWGLTVSIFSAYLVYSRRYQTAYCTENNLYACAQGLMLEQQEKKYPLILEQAAIGPAWIFLRVSLSSRKKLPIMVWKWQLNNNTRKKLVVLLDNIGEKRVLPLKNKASKAIFQSV